MMDTKASEQEAISAKEYEDLFVSAVFKNWTNHTISGAKIVKNDHVLDIACGTGVLARHVLLTLGLSGRTVGLDLAPGMLAAARQIEPGIEWVQGDATSLPFSENSFDCTVCQFGLMFFPDRLQALREMCRVTKPKGRVSIAVWNGIDQNPLYQDVTSILDSLVSVQAGNASRLPFSLGDKNLVTDLLVQAGFEDIEIQDHIENATFPSTLTIVEAELRGWLPLFGINLSETEIQAVLNQSVEPLAKYKSGSGKAVFPISGYVISAAIPE